MLTGATTPLGIRTAETLLADPDIGHVLAVGLEKEATGLPTDNARLTYQRVDLTRARQIRQLLYGPVKDLGLDAIIHSALHRRATDTGRKVYRLNVDSTRAMLRMAEPHPTLKRFVYRSFFEVYRIEGDQPDVLREDVPLNLSPGAPQWIRDRVEGDVTAATAMGLSDLKIAILRCAEILAPDSGSQLHDYLQSQVCFRPLGYDPMLNLLTIDDAVRALHAALKSDAQGAFNIPGYDTLPLTAAVRLWGRTPVPVPGPLMGPLYRLRVRALGTDFRYDLNQWRFHFSGVPDGDRARRVLGYEPQNGIQWPVAGER